MHPDPRSLPRELVLAGQKVKPWDHQAQFLLDHWWKPARALWWEQGTGKTKPLIENGVLLWRYCGVNAMLVLASPAVARNWHNTELPAHLPQDVVVAGGQAFLWRSDQAVAKWHQRELETLVNAPADQLVIVCMSYHGFMSKAGRAFANRLRDRRRVYNVDDESHNFKTPGAKRTKAITAYSGSVPFRRIATGTAITTGPFDAYSQIKALDRDFWRRRELSPFSVFKTHFARYEKGYNRAQGREYETLVEYQNLEELNGYINLVGNRVMKEDVLDLPPKLYQRLDFELSPEQRRAYDTLSEEFMIELEGGAVLTAELAISRLLRLQQITCGYLPLGDEADENEWHEFKDNRRLELVEELRDMAATQQIVIWSRFSRCIDKIMDVLGDQACRFDGKVSPEVQERSKLAFQAGEKQYIVVNQAAGSEGLTLHKGKMVIVYSNTFSLRQRLQLEDRTHRGGMGDEHCTYWDVLADNTVDHHIVDTLRAQREVSAVIQGDRLKEWIAR